MNQCMRLVIDDLTTTLLHWIFSIGNIFVKIIWQNETNCDVIHSTFGFDKTGK